jgi:hypothetical protein
MNIYTNKMGVLRKEVFGSIWALKDSCVHHIRAGKELTI